MSERTGADAGPPVTLRAGLRHWFLRPPRPHGEVIEDRRVSFLELTGGSLLYTARSRGRCCSARWPRWRSAGPAPRPGCSRRCLT